MAEPLRAHHLLCTALYQGQGYDGNFEGNMGLIARKICGEKDLNLCLVDSPDNICRECPNLVEGACVLDNNSVVETDRKVLDLLARNPGECLPAGQCRKILREKITAEIFEDLCGGCTWRKKGLCSFEQLKSRLAVRRR